jgi:hypothetical protein
VLIAPRELCVAFRRGRAEFGFGLGGQIRPRGMPQIMLQRAARSRRVECACCVSGVCCARVSVCESPPAAWGVRAF